MYDPNRGKQPGDMFHRRTEIRLGRLSGAVPLPLKITLLMSGFVVAIFMFLVARIIIRMPKRRN
jgi:hypothetical protein